MTDDAYGEGMKTFNVIINTTKGEYPKIFLGGIYEN